MDFSTNQTLQVTARMETYILSVSASPTNIDSKILLLFISRAELARSHPAEHYGHHQEVCGDGENEGGEFTMFGVVREELK